MIFFYIWDIINHKFTHIEFPRPNLTLYMTRSEENNIFYMTEISKFKNMFEFIVSNVSNIKKLLNFVEYKCMFLSRNSLPSAFFPIYNISFQYGTPCTMHLKHLPEIDHLCIDLNHYIWQSSYEHFLIQLLSKIVLLLIK